MLHYFLWANINVLLFWGIYMLTIKGTKNHAWGRFYLIATLLVSAVLPLIRINLATIKSIGQVHAINLPELILNVTEKQDFAVKAISWNVIYLLIVLLLILQLAYRLIALKRFLNNQSLEYKDGVRIGLNTGYGPASFGNVIVFPGNEVDSAILNHERAHLSLKHHYDKLLFQLFRCFFFPVLVFHLMYRELMLIHEFEADEQAAADKESYSKTLLAAHFGSKQLYLLQNFFHHPLKRRIVMLYKNKQNNLIGKSALITLSAFALFSLVLLQNNKKALAKEITIAGTEMPEQDTLKKKTVDGKDNVYSSVEHVPEFPGGMTELMNYLSSNIRYPEAARKQNIQGRVIVQFVVGKKGEVKNVVIIRDLAGGCGAEAKRVVEAMPRWTPGRQDGEAVSVYYTLPITFKFSS